MSPVTFKSPAIVTSPVVVTVANCTSLPVANPWFIAFTAASFVNSLSITAPAAVTFVASVTSAAASIAFNLLWSASVNVFESLPASTAATTCAEEDIIPSPIVNVISLSLTVVVIELSPVKVNVSPVV